MFSNNSQPMLLKKTHLIIATLTLVLTIGVQAGILFSKVNDLDNRVQRLEYAVGEVSTLRAEISALRDELRMFRDYEIKPKMRQ
jgi:hypothetical protein